MSETREPAYPEDAAKWAALTGSISDEAMQWAEEKFGTDQEVKRAS